MILSDNLFDQALSIGFTVGRWQGEINHISLPCSAKTKNGKYYDYLQLNYLPDKNVVSGYLFGEPTIEDIKLDVIEESPFAMPLVIRNASTHPEDYRNDWPFFIMLKNGDLLGYNAVVPVDFISFDKKYKTLDVDRRVLMYSDERPLDKKFQFIQNMDKAYLQVATFNLTNEQLKIIEQLASP